jgi:hypothetical protein
VTNTIKPYKNKTSKPENFSFKISELIMFVLIVCIYFVVVVVVVVVVVCNV